jgi:uncharacterized protein YdcH (DUF465 family)
MISKLSDNDALDLLMTSDFQDDISPKELKEMLLRYRYFYRILHAKMDRITQDGDFEKSKLMERCDLLNGMIMEMQIKCVTKDDKIERLKKRKLTFKERILGKIIEEDEDK